METEAQKARTIKTASFFTKESRNTILRRLPWLVLIPLGLLLPRIAAADPDLIERVYSRGVYPVIHILIRTITSIVSFSIAEWLLYALIFAVPASLLYRAIRALLLRERWIRFLHLCVTYLIVFGMLLNGFYITWGFNYSRPKLSQLMALEVYPRPAEELESLCYTLAELAVDLRAQVKEDENGIFRPIGGNIVAVRKLPDAYAALGRVNPLFNMQATNIKRVVNSEAMSWGGISGVYIPFTAEPNVNMHQPSLLLISSAAHEMAHAMGIAREDEANFVSFLACMSLEDADVRYSGVMLALIHCGNQFFAADADAYRTLYDTYSEGMRRDLSAHSAYWKGYEGPVEETVNRVNDNYLRHNQQESGVKSYGEMVDLLLAWAAQAQ